MIYLLTLLAAWLVNGCTKFSVNYARFGKAAHDLVGYGGFPSTHTAVVTAVVVMVGLQNGFEHPAFGIGLALLWIVITDARSLRRMVGDHAEHLNTLSPARKKHRERVGHSYVEIAGGALVGTLVACGLYALMERVVVGV